MRGEDGHAGLGGDGVRAGRDLLTRKLTIRRRRRKPRGAAALLPAGDAAHVGQLVGDALVAIDAGLLAGEQEALVRDRRRAALCLVMSMDSALWQLRHSSESLALSRAHSCCASSSRLIEELLARVDGAERSCPRPPWTPASCARSCRSSCAARGSRGSSRARRSGWCSGWSVFSSWKTLSRISWQPVQNFSVLVSFERGVEAAPEDDAGDEAAEHQEAEAEHRARPAQHVPQLDA